VRSIRSYVAGNFAIAVVLILVSSARSASAQVFNVMYRFCSETNCTDGWAPDAGLISDPQGDFYGTTSMGGAYGWGTVFKLTKTGKETVLYSFKGGGNDGGHPYAGVIRDDEGNLYGTTLSPATVYKISKTGQETVLYNFVNAVLPYAGVIRDSKGNLYGATQYGGDTSCDTENGGCGLVFKLDRTGKQTVQHEFHGADGAYPYGSLMLSADGYLYGTTRGGGSRGWGTVFKLSKTGNQTVLFSFTGPDGVAPYGGLIEDGSGNFYGATSGGGVLGGGDVFKLSKTGEETVLYNFCSDNCLDGFDPYSSVVRDPEGNIYGTTLIGGPSNDGVVFKLDRNNQDTVLHSFCSESNCADGWEPYAGLLRDAQGTLYGTTTIGGGNSNCINGCGVVFKITTR
jgi:uncharacterized repeat protein (TIGR03803 family)